jgi:hypothetical protein
MILSRVIDHVRAQNWTAIAIDFVIVVMGVFIGIQVSNWNDARVQSARQQVYVERLREDFIGIRERVEEHLKVYGGAIEGGDYLLAIVRADANDPAAIVVDDDRVGRAFNSLSAQRIPPPLPATYVEMVSEGQLSSLRNSTLRAKLAEYDRLASVVQEVSRAVIDLAMAQTPILYRHFVSRSMADDRVLSGIEEQVLSYDVPGMRDDPEFAVAVTLLRRNALNSLQQRRIQLRLIGEILSLLDAEHDKVGLR